MGKDQTIIKDTQSQGQGVCEKIFKALNLTSVFRYFSGHPKSKITTTDHHRSDPAKATKFKLVVPQKDQNLSFASNRVHVEYNHSEVDTEISKSRDPPQNQDFPYDSSSNGRFSSYIDHVRSKIMSSFGDDDSASGVRRDGVNDKITLYKFEIKATAIACGNQG